MSDLLNKASLVMIPSGYKEDTVFSQLPQDGSGDLSFTRASNGTRINSAGLVEVCPWNLCTYSEQFQNADWLGGGNGKPTMTDNFAEAPNGTMTASKMEAASDGYQLRQNNAQENTQMNLSVWLRTNTGTKTIQLFMNNASTASQNITVTTTWTRYEISGLVTTLAGSGRNGLNTLEALTSSNYILVWGFQLSVGLTAKPYFPTTDRLNVPRLTYQNGGGGCPSLLLEKQSTNLVTYSEQFDDASWSLGNASITANATTSPDGTQNAEKLYTNTATSTHQIRKTISSVTAQNYTMSIFAKKGELNYIRFWEDGQTGKQAYFNLNTGVATNVDMTSASIENMGNGWFRCSAVVAIPASGVFGYRVLLTPDGTTTSFTGNGSDGVFLYGAQLEASSYPTSYIPTTSSSATRVADACFKTGISSLIGQQEGSLFAQVSIPNGAEGSRAIAVQGGSDRVGITVDGTSVGFFIVNSSGVVYSVATTIAWQPTNKLAVAYKSGNSTLYVNGSAVLTTTASFTLGGAMANVYLGQYEFAPGTGQNGQSQSQAILFPTRLTNAELALLTSL